MSSRHQTVLLHEAVEALNLANDAVVLDATAGAGGHARLIIEKLDERGVYVGMDADKSAIDALRGALAGKPRIILANENFRHLAKFLGREGIAGLDAALFDLGWRAEQLTAGRGFSFQTDEPLLMTYQASPSAETLTAREIVSNWDEMSIADIIYGWGEERFARRIAKAIVERRAKAPIETTLELADVVSRAVPGWYRTRRIHPATKTFQALRIAVNDEMGALTEALGATLALMHPGGRLAAISFHSIEDRVVKQFLKAAEGGGVGKILTKKPITPGVEEIARNPRARSAKLRVFEKQKI